MISRRSLFGVTAAGIASFFVRPRPVQAEELDVPERPLSTNARTRLLQQCGSRKLVESREAMEELVESLLRDYIVSHVQLETQVPIKLNMTPKNRGKGLKCQDLGTSMDWLLRDAREENWKDITKGVDLMIDMLVKKVNSCKTKTSYITYFGVFDDPTLHRQRRCGIYAWVELENATPYKG
jgi:hypothetical protein